MSVREVAGRIVQSVWRVFGQAGKEEAKIVGQNKKKGFRTLEIEGGNPPPHQVAGSSRQHAGEGWGGARQRRNSTCVNEVAVSHSQGASGVVRGFDFGYFGSARRVLIDNVLKRVTNSQAAVLRRRAVHQLTSQGNSAPFLALVGVSLASGSGIITKEDEIESICYEIRRAVGKTRLLQSEEEVVETQNREHQWCLQDFELGKPIAKGCAAVVYSARVRREEAAAHQDFPLAVKMMFNYHAESNAFTILRAMHRETVPARSVHVPGEMDSLYTSLDTDQIKLMAHPNIVEMVTVFADQVPGLPGDVQLYGDALPARLNPRGCGRNMSLFLVMKKYDLSLADYLEKYRDLITPRTSLILLTQLLEGISFLSSSGVAHRDLKCDNLLLSLSGGPQFPHLVITDFGCCSADKTHRLRLPYRTWDMDKGGNAALMAPEVVMARPGTFSTISYERSDMWTAGTLAYQIYCGENPFYSQAEASASLDSRTFTSTMLPPLPDNTPWLVSRLVSSMLSRNPGDRPTPRLAATICQLLVRAPSSWYRGGDSRPPGTQDILQWLLTMTAKVVCESRWGNTAGALFEYQLVATFLATMTLKDIRAALAWIQENVEESAC
eukprot:TRINITY_DN27057_c0_g1_i6.p1 TRINITY_DN27057_c0_g1~~TRINITY_DN27057_c0_g1_i6.p1  ORF type:complete len:608 (+),score=230.42 TRINITY_DN27057_c0_g1_i6:140-1963(+)